MPGHLLKVLQYIWPSYADMHCVHARLQGFSINHAQATQPHRLCTSRIVNHSQAPIVENGLQIWW